MKQSAVIKMLPAVARMPGKPRDTNMDKLPGLTERDF